MADKLIHLAFSNPNLQPETVDVLSCITCRNKTFVFQFRAASHFAVAKCAACGTEIGHVGWADATELKAIDEEENNEQG